MQFKNQSTLLAILACIVWSTAFVGIKIGLRYTTPLHLAGLRFFIAGLLILPFCKNYQANFKTIWENKCYISDIKGYEANQSTAQLK